MTANELIDLTGHSPQAVRAALNALREAGLVARQETTHYAPGYDWPSRAVWLWRRMRR